MEIFTIKLSCFVGHVFVDLSECTRTWFTVRNVRGERVVLNFRAWYQIQGHRLTSSLMILDACKPLFFIFVINWVFNTHVYTVNCVICLFIDFSNRDMGLKWRSKRFQKSIFLGPRFLHKALCVQWKCSLFSVTVRFHLTLMLIQHPWQHHGVSSIVVYGRCMDKQTATIYNTSTSYDLCWRNALTKWKLTSQSIG